jgi:nicotinate phosphoribosyltransferase
MAHEPCAAFVSDGNFALATDLYELTMAAGYLRSRRNEPATFELFARDLPPRRSYLLAAGLEQAVHYLTHLRFTEPQIAYLRSQPVFAEVGSEFFDYLRGFRFRGDLDAMPEGTVAFANEPLLRVTAPILDAQIVETYLLTTVAFQTLVAAKASRVVAAARGRSVVDFGSRRAHGPQAGLLAARAAYIGGCDATSNVLAGWLFGIPIAGTQAHSWVMSFEEEEEAFRAYHEVFPKHTVLLLDTYDTLAAARKATAFGPALRGVRLDSGNLLALSRRVRRILDDAGMRRTRILASGDLNECRIARLIRAGAPIDAFGVGTDMVTSRDAPALSCVYKLVEQQVGGHDVPRLKRSAHKGTYPGRKQAFRLLDKRGRYRGDLIGLDGEPLDGEKLLVPILRGGELVGPLPSLRENRERAAQGLERLPPRFRRIQSPAQYPVRWSARIHALREAVDRRLREGKP